MTARLRITLPLALLALAALLAFAASSAHAQTPPRVQTVTSSDITRTSATVAVNLDGTPGSSTTIYHRYRANSQSGWPAPQQGSYATTSQRSTFDLSGLSGGVTYDVEVSANADYSSAVAIEFTTTSVASVELRSVGPAVMEALISIRHPGSSNHTVRIQYRESARQRVDLPVQHHQLRRRRLHHRLQPHRRHQLRVRGQLGNRLPRPRHRSPTPTSTRAPPC